jgi:hypothetical protein
MIPTQPRTTFHVWLAHQRIHLASAPVDNRSWAARRSTGDPPSVPVCCSVMLEPPRSDVFC